MNKHQATYYNLYEAVKKALNEDDVIFGNQIAKTIPLPLKNHSRKLGFAKDIQILSGFDEISEGFEEYI